MAGRAYFAVSFQKGLLAHLGERRYIVPFVMKLFNITGQNENAYAIAKRLILHHNMNRNKSSKNQHRLSVEVLLKCCPNLADMPIGDMRRTLERALDCLSTPTYNSALLTWHYLIRGKTNAQELLSKLRLSKAEWEGLILEFEFAHNLPDWGIFDDGTRLDTAYEIIDSMDVEYVLFEDGKVNTDLLQQINRSVDLPSSIGQPAAMNPASHPRARLPYQQLCDANYLG